LGLSLFLGRPVEEVQPYSDRREEVPAQRWLEAKRGGREAAAQLDCDTHDPVDILRYWADKDLAADVLNVDAGVLLIER
jgi:hypothetical protein